MIVELGSLRLLTLAFDAKSDALMLLAGVYDSRDDYLAPLRYSGVSEDWDTMTRLAVDHNWSDWATVAQNAAGDVVIVATTTSNYKLEARRFVAATGTWSDPEDMPLSNVEHTAYEPSVTLDSAGNAVAVWEENNLSSGDRFVVASALRASSNSWDEPVELGSASVYDNPLLHIAMSPPGEAMVSYFGKTRVYHPSTGVWDPAVPVDAAATNMLLACGTDGDAIGVWLEDSGSGSMDVRASIYSSTENQWTASALVDTLSTTAAAPNLIVDPQGNATVIWTQAGDLLGRRFDFASGDWEPTPSVIEGGAADPTDAKSVVDRFGNVTVIWLQSSDQSLWARRFVHALGAWSDAVEIAPEASQSVDLAVDPEGRVLVAWTADDAANIVWFN